MCADQTQFIQLCKTFYELFTEEPNEQELFHSIATVATLLLQIGEVGKQFQSSIGDSSSPRAPTLPDDFSAATDSGWTISFEQLLASMLTESPLVSYFEKSVDVIPAIDRFRSWRLLRQSSSSPPKT